MANTLVFSGAQSAAFSCDVEEGYISLLKSPEWALMEAGQLKAALTRSYENYDEFFEALAQAGLTAECWIYYGSGEFQAVDNGIFQALRWSLDSTTKTPILAATLTTEFSSPNKFYIRIQSRYSASE